MIKPAIMICVEPVLIVMTLYISIVYGILVSIFETRTQSYIALKRSREVWHVE